MYKKGVRAQEGEEGAVGKAIRLYRENYQVPPAAGCENFLRSLEGRLFISALISNSRLSGTLPLEISTFPLRHFFLKRFLKMIKENDEKILIISSTFCMQCL